MRKRGKEIEEIEVEARKRNSKRNISKQAGRRIHKQESTFQLLLKQVGRRAGAAREAAVMRNT